MTNHFHLSCHKQPPLPECFYSLRQLSGRTGFQATARSLRLHTFRLPSQLWHACFCLNAAQWIDAQWIDAQWIDAQWIDCLNAAQWIDFSGRMGLLGNLATAQIVEQVVEARRFLAAEKDATPLTNLVYMGMVRVGSSSVCVSVCVCVCVAFYSV